jgi:uncharacterized protein (DUF2252 family)
LKLELENLTRPQVSVVAGFLATILSRAHARQLDVHARQQWATEIERSRTKILNAPSWLWPSVVDVMANQERGYLKHRPRHFVARDRAN